MHEKPKTILDHHPHRVCILNCGQKDYDRIYEVGITGVGLVSKVEDTNVTINDNPKVRLYVTVYTLNKEPFEAVVTSVVSRLRYQGR